MTTPFMEQPARHRRWSWLSFAAGIVVGVIGFFALGSVLFSDDVSTALQEEERSVTGVERVHSHAAELQSCDPHDRRCHNLNAARVGWISAAMSDLPPRLNNALVSFSTEHESFTERGCGINKSNAICGLTGLNLNLSVSTIKTEALSLE